MKEEWLFPNAIVPVDVETTAALVAEIHRLIGVVGGMALAQPDDLPIAYMRGVYDGKNKYAPQREWVGLTDEQIEAIAKNYSLVNQTTPLHFARAIEAKLREKNGC